MSVPEFTPAEAAGWQIIDGLDEETKAKLYELLGQSLPEDVIVAIEQGDHTNPTPMD